MKITNIKSYIFEYPLKNSVVTSFGEMKSRPALIIEIKSSDNISGLGEIWCNFPSQSAYYKQNLIHGLFAKYLKDIEFYSPKEFYNKINAKLSIMLSQTGDEGIFQNIIAGFDIAIWDIFGKKKSKPINKILNKNAGNFVKTYASGINPKNCLKTVLDCRKKGFDRFKLKIGFDFKSDEKNIELISANLEKNEELMADVNQGWETTNSEKYLKKINKFSLKWIEEPILARSKIEFWKKNSIISKNFIACGENIRNLDDFIKILKIKKIKYIQPDICKWGGFSEIFELLKKIKFYKKIYCPHFLGSGIGLIASAHLLSSSDNKGFLEVDINPNPLRSEFIKKELADGNVFKISKIPGLGILRIPNAIKKYIKTSERSKIN